MPREDHANTMFWSVDGNFIFAACNGFLKSQKNSCCGHFSLECPGLAQRFLQYSRGWIHQTHVFPKLIQIPEMGHESGIKVLKTLIIVPAMLTL